MRVFLCQYPVAERIQLSLLANSASQTQVYVVKTPGGYSKEKILLQCRCSTSHKSLCHLLKTALTLKVLPLQLARRAPDGGSISAAGYLEAGALVTLCGYTGQNNDQGNNGTVRTVSNISRSLRAPSMEQTARPASFLLFLTDAPF